MLSFQAGSSFILGKYGLRSLSSGTNKRPSMQRPTVSHRSLGKEVRWKCSVGEGEPKEDSNNSILAKSLLGTSYAVYLYLAFLSPDTPGQNIFDQDPAQVTKLAFDLSLNFWFVMPVFLSKFAPTLHPGLEGIFNFTVIYGVGLMVGFLSDGGENQRPKTSVFSVLVAFLTNVFYPMYLLLRRPNSMPPSPAERDTPFMRLAESKVLPAFMLGIGLLSVIWGLYGRPDGGFGDIPQRVHDLLQITSSDRLAWTFFADSTYFALLQGALVPDDMKRRGFEDPTTRNIATFVPFLGTVYYLFVRPPLLSVQGDSNKDD